MHADPVRVNIPQPLPELKTPVTAGITYQVYGNPHQPGLNARLATEPSPGFVCVQEAILGQGFRGAAVTQGCQGEAKYSRPIKMNDCIEVRSLCGAMLHHRGSGRGRFHSRV